MWRVVVAAAALEFVQYFFCCWKVCDRCPTSRWNELEPKPKPHQFLGSAVCWVSFASFGLVWLWSMVYMLAQFRCDAPQLKRFKPFWTEALCLTRLRHCNFSLPTFWLCGLRPLHSGPRRKSRNHIIYFFKHFSKIDSSFRVLWNIYRT